MATRDDGRRRPRRGVRPPEDLIRTWRTLVDADLRVRRLRRWPPRLIERQRIMGRPRAAAVVFGIQAAACVAQLAAGFAMLEAFHLGAAGLRGAALVMVLTNLIGLVPAMPGNVGTFQVAAVSALSAQNLTLSDLSTRSRQATALLKSAEAGVSTAQGAGEHLREAAPSPWAGLPLSVRPRSLVPWAPFTLAAATLTASSAPTHQSRGCRGAAGSSAPPWPRSLSS